MTPETVLEIGRQAITTTLMIAAPMLLAALLVGLVISVFQAATSINEATLQFIPKLVVMFLMLMFAGPWMLETLMDFMTRLYNNIPQLIG